MANTAFDHVSSLTIPGSTTNNGLVRWGDTSGTSFGNITGITSDGSNLTLLTRGEIRFSDADSTHYIALESPATVSTSYTMTLPADLPAANEVLTVTSYSSGAGVLEWAAAGGTTINTNADNRVITGSGTANTLNGESGLTFDGTTFYSAVKMGINTSTPDAGQYLHILGANGTITENSGVSATTTSQMTIENNSNAAISILSPAADFGAVYFGDSNDNIAGGLIYNHGATRFDVRVEGATKYILAPTLMTVPGGINFPDTQVASADANTLDDYEEGQWTPVARTAAHNTATQGTVRGLYTKIGNVVFVQFAANTNDISGLTGGDNMEIHGLPFTSTSLSTAEGNIYSGNGYSLAIGAGDYMAANVPTNVALLRLMVWNNATGTVGMTATQWSAGGNVRMSGHYYID